MMLDSAREGPHQGTHTLVFERRSDKRFHMRLEEDEGSKVEFEPLQLVKPDTKQFSAYAGRYFGSPFSRGIGMSAPRRQLKPRGRVE